MNKKSSRKYGDMLEKLNNGSIPKFQDGGFVGGRSPSVDTAQTVLSPTQLMMTPASMSAIDDFNNSATVLSNSIVNLRDLSNLVNKLAAISPTSPASPQQQQQQPQSALNPQDRQAMESLAQAISNIPDNISMTVGKQELVITGQGANIQEILTSAQMEKFGNHLLELARTAVQRPEGMAGNYFV